MIRMIIWFKKSQEPKQITAILKFAGFDIAVWASTGIAVPKEDYEEVKTYLANFIELDEEKQP